MQANRGNYGGAGEQEGGMLVPTEQSMDLQQLVRDVCRFRTITVEYFGEFCGARNEEDRNRTMGKIVGRLEAEQQLYQQTELFGDSSPTEGRVYSLIQAEMKKLAKESYDLLFGNQGSPLQTCFVTPKQQQVPRKESKAVAALPASSRPTKESIFEPFDKKPDDPFDLCGIVDASVARTAQTMSSVLANDIEDKKRSAVTPEDEITNSNAFADAFCCDFDKALLATPRGFQSGGPLEAEAVTTEETIASDIIFNALCHEEQEDELRISPVSFLPVNVPNGEDAEQESPTKKPKLELGNSFGWADHLEDLANQSDFLPLLDDDFDDQDSHATPKAKKAKKIKPRRSKKASPESDTRAASTVVNRFLAYEKRRVALEKRLFALKKEQIQLKKELEEKERRYRRKDVPQIPF